jgi:hypothetical protein
MIKMVSTKALEGFLFFINSYYKNDVLPPKIFVKRIILNDIVLVLCQIYKFRS